MQLFLHTILFGNTATGYVKEFSADMVKFIKTFDQYPHKFNFGILFQLSSKTVRGFESET